MYSKATTQSYPQNLSFQELANPLSVIREFFVMFDLPDARKELNNWIKYASIKEISKRRPASSLLYFYEGIIKLLESAWLIREMDTGRRIADLSLSKVEEKDLMMTEFYCHPWLINAPYDSFPRSLKRSEYINPYRVFSRLFRHYSLAQWKNELYELLHTSLSKSKHDNESVDILMIKESISKLIDACHLIHIREFEFRNGKVFPKTKRATKARHRSKKMTNHN